MASLLVKRSEMGLSILKWGVPLHHVLRQQPFCLFLSVRPTALEPDAYNMRVFFYSGKFFMPLHRVVRQLVVYECFFLQKFTSFLSFSVSSFHWSLMSKKVDFASLCPILSCQFFAVKRFFYQESSMSMMPTMFSMANEF